MTLRMIRFPKDVIKENTALKIMVRILAIKVSPVCSKFTSEREHGVSWVLFMLKINMTLM